MGTFVNSKIMANFVDLANNDSYIIYKCMYLYLNVKYTLTCNYSTCTIMHVIMVQKDQQQCNSCPNEATNNYKKIKVIAFTRG